MISIIVPCYNEKSSISRIISRLESLKLDKEIIVVDDNSTDGSREEIAKHSVIFISNPVNLGKGASIRRGISRATGDIVVIQDADLEYNPEDIPFLIRPIEQKKADAVFGSRFMGANIFPFVSRLANQFLTFLSNCFTGNSLTDMETGYKAIKRSILDKISLQEDRFGIEPEITAKIALAGGIIKEVPIDYSARTKKEGKKIGFKDGIRAIYCIVKYGLNKG